MKELDNIKDRLLKAKEALEKDELDDKIASKMRAEMDRRKISGKEIADHYRDADETIPAKQRSNIKTSIGKQTAPKPKLAVVKDDMEKAEPMYHIHVDGYRVTDKPATLKDIVAKHGPVKRLEADGKTKLVPHNNEVSKAEHCKTSEHGQWKIEKSNYGPKGMGLYNPADNIKRKAKNTGESVADAGKNVNVKNYTTSGSTVEAARQAAENKRQKANPAPVKTLKDMSPEEKAALESKHGAKIKE